MFRVLLLVVGLTLVGASVHAQPSSPDPMLPDSTLAEAYRVFRTDGQPATLDDVLEAMDSVEVVFLGEQHDDPVAHYLQAELLQRAFVRQTQESSARRPMALSLEMFARDVQMIVDEYLADLITESHFLRSSRPWNNYETDYRPLVEFAKAHGLPVLAANAPRRYVNRVSRLGPESLEALSVWAKSALPPLPYPKPTPAYEAKWDRLMAEMMAPKEDEAETATPDTTAHHEASIPDSTATHDAAEEKEIEEAASSPMHGLGYMLDAQAFWDATMAYTLFQHLLATPNVLVMHVVGSFHVEEGLGTPAQLEGYRPGTQSLIVVTKATEDFTTFDAEEIGPLGDFIILTDKTLPRTFEPSAPR